MDPRVFLRVWKKHSNEDVGSASTRTFLQVNNATGLYAFYVDSMDGYYSDKGCSSVRYEVIKQYESIYGVDT